MATIDIGKLTFTHKGDYDGSTAYVANDVVYYNGSAYIAKTSTTGNLPTSTAHWNVFSAGSGGIWNSGLSIGTAGQVVKVNSGASALEFGTVSSDYVKLAGVDLTGSTATQYDFTQFMDDSVYNGYKIFGRYKFSSSSGSLRAKFLNNTTPYEGGTDYFYAGYQAYRDLNHNSGSQLSANSDGNGREYLQIMGWGHNTSYENGFELQIWGKPTTSGERTFYTSRSIGRDGSNPNYVFHDEQGGMLYQSGNTDGIRFYSSSGGSVYLNNFQATIWGMKK